jgi:hypothetical protein
VLDVIHVRTDSSYPLSIATTSQTVQTHGATEEDDRIADVEADEQDRRGCGHIQSTPAQAMEVDSVHGESNPDALTLNSSTTLETSNTSLSLDQCPVIRSEISNNRFERLQDNMHHLANEISQIEASEWTKYNAELKSLCGSDKTAHSVILKHVGKIIFLPEELSAIQKGNFARVEAAICLTAAISELLSLSSDEADLAETEHWMKQKQRNVAWLKDFCTKAEGERHVEAGTDMPRQL